MKKSIIALCLFTCGAYSQPYGDWNLINETDSFTNSVTPTLIQDMGDTMIEFSCGDTIKGYRLSVNSNGTLKGDLISPGNSNNLNVVIFTSPVQPNQSVLDNWVSANGEIASGANTNKFVSHLVTGDDERAIWYELRTKQYGINERQTNFLVSSRGFNSGIEALKKECTK